MDVFEAATQEPCPRGCDAEIARLKAEVERLKGVVQGAAGVLRLEAGLARAHHQGKMRSALLGAAEELDRAVEVR